MTYALQTLAHDGWGTAMLLGGKASAARAVIKCREAGLTVRLRRY